MTPALVVYTEQEVRGYTLQVSGRSALWAEETGSIKVLSVFREWLGVGVAGAEWTRCVGLEEMN